MEVYPALHAVVCLEGLNYRSFEGCERIVFDLKQFLLQTLFDWVSVSGGISCSNFLEFIDCCSFQV